MSKRSLMLDVKSVVDSKRILDTLLRHLTSNKPIGPEDLGTVLNLTSRKIADTLYAQALFIYTLDKNENRIRQHRMLYTPFLYGSDVDRKNFFESKSSQQEQTPLSIHSGIAGLIMRSKRKALVADVRCEPHLYNLVEEDSLFIPRSMIAVPMLAGDMAVGCIAAFNRCPDYETVTQFGEDDVLLLEDVALYTAKIVQKALDPTLAFSPREMASYAARLAKVSYFEIDENFRPDLELFRAVGEDIIRKYEIVPLRAVGPNTCAVTLANPNDFQRINDFEIVTGLKIAEKCVSAQCDIARLLDSALPKPDAPVEKTRLEEAKEAIEKEFGETPARPPSVLTQVEFDNENDGVIVKLSGQIIEDAFVKGASDIHIEPQDKALRVRYRIDGILREVMNVPLAAHRALVSRFKIMSELNISERRLPQDGRIVYKRFNPKHDLDLRVSIIPANHGEKICARILDKTRSTLPLDRLGFSNYNLAMYRDAIQAPYGMVLHCGPTGSGKSMSLYAALNEINSPEWNIITVEDPVEYTLPGLSQVQVKKDIGLTFANALRSFLRQDPDIILVGEIRDLETAEIAIEASLTGHLLFSTLHTNDAPSAIARFDEMGIEPFMVSTCLRCVCAQRLARRVCACSLLEAPTSDERMLLERALDSAPILNVARSQGCAKCEHSGFKGRVGVHEIMCITDEMRRHINKRDSVEILKLVARENGMRTLFEDLMEKVKAGLTTLPEALATARPDESLHDHDKISEPIPVESGEIMQAERVA